MSILLFIFFFWFFDFLFVPIYKFASKHMNLMLHGHFTLPCHASILYLDADKTLVTTQYDIYKDYRKLKCPTLGNAVPLALKPVCAT